MIMDGASLQGSSHKQYDVANQDAFRFGRIAEFEIAIVCDGVSLKLDHTFSHSELAARFCCNFAYSFLEDHLQQEKTMEEAAGILQECFDRTELALRAFLEDREIPFWDCQTTLLILVCSHGQFACAMAGDGGAVFLKEDGKLFVIVTKEKQSSLVEPISVRDGWCFSYYDRKQDPISAFVLATDGVFDQLVSFQNGVPMVDESLLERFFHLAEVPDSKRNRQLKEILEEIPGYDDKTAIVAVEPVRRD